MVTVADMQRAEAKVTAHWEGVEAMPVDSFETGARETDDILGVGTAAAADLRWAGAMAAADLQWAVTMATADLQWLGAMATADLEWADLLISPQGRIYASVNQVSIGSDNGVSPIWRQAIIRTNARLLSIGPLGTNFNEILSKYKTFLSRKCTWKYRLWNGAHFVLGR